MSGYTSCIPEHAEFRSFLLREDFCAITQHDIACAAALRVAEIKTNGTIDYFRREHQGDMAMPPEEWLWFDLTLREIEIMTLGVRTRSTYAYVFALKSGGHHPPSLIQLGFLRRRYIARADGSPRNVATKIHRDMRGQRYIHVLDAQGCYEGTDGTMHDARKEGFPSITRQYLLDIDRVNAAIAALDDDTE